MPVNQKEVSIHKDSPKLDGVVEVKRNSLGFKGDEPPQDFAKWLTILAIGGSTTECLEIADEKTWPLVLGAKLKNNFHHLWINNAGLAGHSTFGHQVLIKDYVAKLRPKVAIFLVGINDVGIKAVNEFDTRVNKGISFRSMDRFLSGLANYSEVAAALLNLKRYYFPKIQMNVVHQEIDYRTIPTLEVPEADKLRKERLFKEKYLQAYSIRLMNLIKVARQNGIDPILLTQPVLYGKVVDQETGVNMAKVKITNDMNGEVAWEVLELYNETTRQVGKAENVPVIDLARELPKDSRYYYDFMHFTNGGAEKVAEIIYHHLQPYLAQNYPDFRLAAGGAN